jgi:hypothetical protein
MFVGPNLAGDIVLTRWKHMGNGLYLERDHLRVSMLVRVYLVFAGEKFTLIEGLV